MNSRVIDEYLIRIRSEHPPVVNIGDTIGGGEVVAIFDGHQKKEIRGLVPHSKITLSPSRGETANANLTQQKHQLYAKLRAEHDLNGFQWATSLSANQRSYLASVQHKLNRIGTTRDCQLMLAAWWHQVRLLSQKTQLNQCPSSKYAELNIRHVHACGKKFGVWLPKITNMAVLLKLCPTYRGSYIGYSEHNAQVMELLKFEKQDASRI